jgi:hypothetical protein
VRPEPELRATFLCHSVIVNYITIARASFFLKKILEAIFLRSNVKSPMGMESR